ncbi:MAG: DUF2848 family protein [Thalassobaculum sp.]
MERRFCGSIRGLGLVEERRARAAGWTGRDKAAIDHHIEELAEIGVPGPVTGLAVEQLTRDHVQVIGGDSSGQVEPVLVAAPRAAPLLTVGPHDTDRKVETYSIAVSK